MQPMLAVQEDAPLAAADLVYEPKYDGIRALIAVTPVPGKKRAAVAIASRAGNDKTAQFPEVAHALLYTASAAMVAGRALALLGRAGVGSYPRDA